LAGVCVKTCPAGYVCDGTKQLTKAKKDCPNGQVEKELKCEACPAGFTCANDLAKADANILKPAEKTDEIGAGATLSVALPLCLTALIVMFK